MRDIIRAALFGFVSLLMLGGAARADEISLLFNIIGSPGTAFMVNALEPWAARVNQQGAGVLHLDVREGMALANFENIYDRVRDDAIQIGWGLQNAVAGKFPLSEVPAVPFLIKRSELGSVAFWRLYKSGLMDAEYDQIVVLAAGMLGAGGLHLNAPMKLADGLNGLKLIVAGRMQSQTVAALEGAPISIPLTDMYQAIQRKLVNGVVTGWGSVQSFKLDQVAPHHIDVSIGASVSMVFMAKAKFQSLPEKARQLLLDTAGEQLSRQFGMAVDKDAATVRDRILAQPGQSVITLPAATLDTWRAKAEPVVTAWAQSRTGGQAVLEKFRALYAEAEAGR